jgi:hypothetical protein
MPRYNRSSTPITVDVCDKASSCASDSMRDTLALYLESLKDLKRTVAAYRDTIMNDLEKTSERMQPRRAHSPTELPESEQLIDAPTGGSKEAIHEWLSGIAPNGVEGSDTKAGVRTASVPMAKLRGGVPLHA